MSARIVARLGKYQEAVDAALQKLENENVVERIWQRDHTVWRPTPEEIENRLGWLDAPEKMKAIIPEIERFVDEVCKAGYQEALLLGMGGSSLAPEVFAKAFGQAEGYLDLRILDSTDPGAVLAEARRIDPANTLFIVSSKSGGTLETLSGFKYFYGQVMAGIGEEKAGEHFVAITDPESKLADMGKRYGFRRVFEGDPNIGGRYSALSHFGLVPAALVGVDLATLQQRAEAAANQSRSIDSPAVRLGALLGSLAEAGRNKLTLVLPEQIASFGDWVEQLVAESTGKEGKGILPVVGETMGKPEAYGEDRLFVAIQLSGEREADLQTLERGGHPVVQLSLDDVYSLGEQFFLWEMATAIAGYLMGIHPYDQPNVEAAKELARKMTAAYLETGELPKGNTETLNPQRFIEHLKSGKKGDYVAIQAFVRPIEKTSAALKELQKSIRNYTRLATTVGYGPRFLHSTGQLHKGDSGQGLFVQLISSVKEDALIPNEVGKAEGKISFGVLKQAQALGDAQALRDAGRRVISFEVAADPVADINLLTRALG